jgi:RNA polymerase-binding transcription factor DksA
MTSKKFLKKFKKDYGEEGKRTAKTARDIDELMAKNAEEDAKTATSKTIRKKAADRARKLRKEAKKIDEVWGF